MLDDFVLIQTNSLRESLAKLFYLDFFRQLDFGCCGSNIKMASNCPKCPFSGTPEQLKGHISIHRSPRPAPTAHLTSGGSTVNVTNLTEDQMEPQVVKKKVCNICQKILAPSSYSRHVKDKHAGTQQCVVCKKSFITDLPLKIIKGKRMLPK